MGTALIIIAGVGIIAICAIVFLELTTPRIDDWDPAETLGADAFIHSDRRVPPADPTLGGPAVDGGLALSIDGDDVAPVVRSHRAPPVLFRVK